jgi:hypothetical protein
MIIDSTTIRLFSDILKGVGRNPEGDGRKKGGMKVHMLINAYVLICREVTFILTSVILLTVMSGLIIASQKS